MKRIIALLITATLSHADQTAIPDYDTARDAWFWGKLYIHGGVSLYCGTVFTETGHYINHKNKKKKMTLEHTYPADWIATYHGCDNRNTCDIPAYKHAEADLHNLWPAQGGVNSSRSDHMFGEIPDDTSENRYATKGCDDFERLYGVPDEKVRVEPRDSVKGSIARSLFYMHDEYGLPLHGMREMLEEWHEEYPVSFEEVWRNKRINELQGTSNKWISER